MATKMATPTAKPIWRTMLITPDPVANDEAGSADVPTPISVGSVSPTPMPDGITQFDNAIVAMSHHRSA